MEDIKRQRGSGITEAEFVLQWGERKRVRCMKLKKDQSLKTTKSTDCLSKRKLISNAPSKIIDTSVNVRTSLLVVLPEKEDRYYTTRGSMGIIAETESGKIIKEPVKKQEAYVAKVVHKFVK